MRRIVALSTPHSSIWAPASTSKRHLCRTAERPYTHQLAAFLDSNQRAAAADDVLTVTWRIYGPAGVERGYTAPVQPGVVGRHARKDQALSGFSVTWVAERTSRRARSPHWTKGCRRALPVVGGQDTSVPLAASTALRGRRNRPPCQDLDYRTDPKR